MDIGDIKQKEMIDVEDDKDQVLSSPTVQASDSQVQDQQVASSQKQVINQAQAIKIKCSNPHTLQEIIQLIKSLVEFKVACKLDQDWHHFVNTSHLCQPKSLPRLKKH